MRTLSIQTRAYLVAAYLAGALILIPRLLNLRVNDPLTLMVLSIAGSVLHILKVEGATNRSHYTFSFLIFGFAILQLDTPQALLVIAISNLAEWIWNRPPWFIQLFNISCYAVATQVSILVYSSINPQGSITSWQAIAGIGASMASFTLVNHLIVGAVLWLARGENFKQSGIFGPVPLLIDLAMLSVGAALTLVWKYNPFALLIFLTPAYPLYMALRIPSLERQTEIDQKTGLYNHQYYMTQLQNELQRANRYDRPLSVIIADLDLLRNINNTYGHLAGDEVLKGVADILRQTVRDYDIVARFGGEEFAILMPETDIEKALQRAEAIRRAVQAAGFVVPTSVEPIKATMSFGIAKRENFEQSGEEILHHADTALYKSKLSGRNRSLAYLESAFLSCDANGCMQPERTEAAAPNSEGALPPQAPGEYAAATSSYVKHIREMANDGPPDSRAEADQPPRPSGRSSGAVRSFIGFVTLAALLAGGASAALSGWTPGSIPSSDWIAFAAIAITIVVTEWFSINLYVKSTSLSTSAVPIISLVVLFGFPGTLAASVIFAATAALKFRSPFNRFLFNLSNHILAGTLINVLVGLAGADIRIGAYALPELLLVLAASVILFVSTTTLISIGIGLDQGQAPSQVWKDQYRWMLPYYLGMGFIAFALLFGYVHAGLLGIVTMLIPLVLIRVSQAQYVERTRLTVNEIRQKNQELERAAVEINSMNEGLLTTLSEIIDLRDPCMLGHSKHVSSYAADIARSLGLNEKQVELIRKAGLLHDIGKLGIPMEILGKPGRLTPAEYEIIKSHAVLGSELVKTSPSLRSLAPIIRHHHEAYDGKGYPDRLSGNNISIEARIVAVADTIEAMTSDRPYRKALRIEHVIEELNRCSGTQFDPLVVKAAIAILEAAREAELQRQVDGPNPAARLKINMQTT